VINPLENLVKEVLANLPASSQQLSEDMRNSLRGALEVSLKKLNLVSRDEFEAQRALLDRLREQLKQLESRLTELEKH